MTKIGNLAIKSQLIHHSFGGWKEINYDNNEIVWKYPPYYIKNFIIDKIIEEINNYFKNFDEMLIIMYFNNKDFVHKIPLNLPCKKIE